MFQSINNVQLETIVQSITNAQPETMVQSITNIQLQSDIKDQLEAKDQPEIKKQLINTKQLIAGDSNNLNWIFELQDIFENSFQLQDISEGLYQNIEESYDNLYENNEPEDSIVSEIYSDLDEDSYEDDEPEDSFEIRTVKSEKEEDKESVCIDYKFTVNASYRRSKNLVFVNKFVSQHNHNLQNQDSLQEFLPALYKIPVLKKILRKKYPNQDIHSQDLYNAIHKFKTDTQVKNNAAALLEYLVQLLNDSNQKSHIVAIAVVCDEMVSTYEWILEQTKHAIEDLQPKTLFIDTDPAIQIAINNQYPKIIIKHCAFHI
ncbi:32672_t:CDS:2 [Racocetra persica]|uniref:32672_t:CDS:1 n=1 Tax=Racocetra persica TaxID=160502 RepID=A0ACA9NTA8_9GLOM|nr:32672_t:CDS:2 [Racocetra persica]